MSEIDLLVCERTGRWAAALRAGVARQARLNSREPRIHEARSLEEFAKRLETWPLGLALLEVHLTTLSKRLSWLADHSRRFPRIRFVALLDDALGFAASREIKRPSSPSQNVVAALLEAGAADFAHSPRRLKHVFALAERHAAIAADANPQPNPAQSIADWAWSQLPWQIGRE
ncbi:MAG TPA: hypothetical protein VJ828_03640 [Lacipirellulaceae bacterium]|nr:hypothetical protein [Lacipirellulaceae bacterium]